MKKLIFASVLVFFFSCANSSKKVEKVNSRAIKNTEIANEPVTTVEKTEEDRTPVEQAAPVSAPVVVSYNALNEAVKAQNDEGIQKASSELLTQNPKDVRALNALGLYHYKKSRFEAAQFLFNKALVVNPSSSEVLGNLALVELAKGDRRDAIRTMRKALEVNPDDANVGANLGSLYVQDKDYFKALLALEIPIKKGFKDIKIMNNYAISLAGSGKIKEAAEIYEKLLKENQSQREVMLNYAILLIENMQKNKEGLDLLSRLKFVGAPSEARDTIKNLENKAKAGLQ